jgi:hypothetical protein
MLRHILYLIGLSVAAVFLKSQLVHVLHFLMYLHGQIANGLKIIFSDDAVGEILQSVLALLLIPIVLGVIAALVHFVIKQEHFPHTMSVVWACWAVLLVAVLSGVSKHISSPVAENIPDQTQGQLQGQPQMAQNGKGQMQGQPKMAQDGRPAMQQIR